MSEQIQVGTRTRVKYSGPFGGNDWYRKLFDLFAVLVLFVVAVAVGFPEVFDVGGVDLDSAQDLLFQIGADDQLLEQRLEPAAHIRVGVVLELACLVGILFPIPSRVFSSCLSGLPIRASTSSTVFSIDPSNSSTIDLVTSIFSGKASSGR